MSRYMNRLAVIAIATGFVASIAHGAEIVWVHQSRGAGNTLDWEDDQWRELLEGAGNTIIEHAAFDDLDVNPEGLDILNSADLVIFSRDSNSGDYNEPDEQEAWTEGVTVPMIIMTPFVVRSSRWDMAESAAILDVDKDTGFGPLVATQPDHPVFAGVLDNNNEAIVFDVDALGIDDSIDFLDTFDDDGKVGNGEVLAIESAFEVPWLIYWEAGTEFYDDTVLGYTAGGPRLYYSVGSDDDPNSWGEKNTTEAGDQILLNAINWLAGTTLTGDFNKNGVLDLPDIDDLTVRSASGANPAEYDLNGDSLVDDADVKVWAKDLFKTWIGDADLDGEFNTADLVTVLASGTYEVDVDSVWSKGDFNGDGRTNTNDLVAALSDGGYEAGPVPAVAAVPEPASLALLVIGMSAIALRRRR